MARRLLLLLAALTLLAVGGCGGCEKDDASLRDGAAAPHDTEFFEPVPALSAIEAKVSSLLAEFEPRVDEATRASAREYATAFGSPAALDDPVNSVEAYLVIGEIAFIMGSASGATWAFLKAVELEPDNPYALSQLGFVLGYEERYNEARPFLLFGHSVEEELHTILINLADNYEALGEVERCVYYLELAVTVQPDNGEIRHKMAKCYFKAGYDQAGQDALEIAQSLAPYDPDIAVTSGAPPDSTVEPSEPGNIFEPGGNEEDAGKLIEAVGNCQMQYGVDYGENVGPIVGAGGEFDQHAGRLIASMDNAQIQRVACETACAELPQGGERDKCEADCAAAECMTDSAAYGEYRRRMLSSRTVWASKHGAVVSGFAGCAWPEYFRLRKRVPTFERDAASAMIWTQLEAAQEIRLVTWYDVDETLQIWLDDITQLCNQAAATLEEVDWENATYFDPFKDLDIKICSPLSENFCLKMTNTSVSVTTPISIGSPANLEFTFDARTGKFNATVTVPLASKSVGGGTVEGAANLKFDMEKGVGVQGEGKLGGPLNKNWSIERFLFTGQ